VNAWSGLFILDEKGGRVIDQDGQRGPDKEDNRESDKRGSAHAFLHARPGKPMGSEGAGNQRIKRSKVDIAAKREESRYGM
jgi:hypothetical protein